MQKLSKNISSSSCVWDYLPEEVIAEILCRLPVKSILQYASVCKLWYSLIIKNPNFIYAHLKKTVNCFPFSSNNSMNHYFLCESWNKNCYQPSLYMDNEQFEECKPLYIPFEPNTFTWLVGSCNGLICLRFQRKFMLWNPLIGKSRTLHMPYLTPRVLGSCNLGLGFDSTTYDFKVLGITNSHDRSYFKAELFSLSYNSWKDITDITPKYDSYDYGCFVNGASHWIVSSNMRKLIMVFDVNDEVFHEFSLPESLQNHNAHWSARVRLWKESTIAVIVQYKSRKYESDIWVMNEYGVASSWVKLATVGKKWRGDSTVFGFRNNGEVMMRFGKKMFQLDSLNLNSQRRKNLMKLPRCQFPSFHSFVGSLLLLDKEIDKTKAEGIGTSS